MQSLALHGDDRRFPIARMENELYRLESDQDGHPRHAGAYSGLWLLAQLEKVGSYSSVNIRRRGEPGALLNIKEEARTAKCSAPPSATTGINAHFPKMDH